MHIKIILIFLVIKMYSHIKLQPIGIILIKLFKTIFYEICLSKRILIFKSFINGKTTFIGTSQKVYGLCRGYPKSYGWCTRS